ncbi:carbon-nitrogen hydrolase family protein [Brevibacillus fluminis]|uniref:Carbon-nitrogen hydrolase family protein n=1 Tax=Brevibacillus fluminis TaxID=511487 RepID=A0A3M8DNU4_9BACL|nr:carbon-nitrogen hydrolase family protein [Brevibacillus fluminis]RNB89763.1 carbon-nitrogen hydrolase family protein [Brevibacillus fluminis]
MRLSIAQIETQLNQKFFNLEKITRYVREARRQQSDLVVFPELCLTGYSIGPWLAEAAESLGGPCMSYMKALCREEGIHVLYSFPEREQERYYVTTALINDRGEVLGIYRKTHLFDEERVFFSSGSELPVFETKFGTIGIMSCFDLEFPEVARILRLKGASMILIPTSNMQPYKEYQLIYTQCRAMENEIPVALCNRIGFEGEMTFIGESTFVDGYGKTHALLCDKEEIVTFPVLLFRGTDPKIRRILNGEADLFEQLLHQTKRSSNQTTGGLM